MTKIILNLDKEHVKKIQNALNENKELYGKRYCPCSIIKNDDTVCPCKSFRENQDCHCKLYMVVEDEENTI